MRINDPAARLLAATLDCDADVLLMADAEFEQWRIRNLPTAADLDAAFAAAGEADPFK